MGSHKMNISTRLFPSHVDTSVPFDWGIIAQCSSRVWSMKRREATVILVYSKFLHKYSSFSYTRGGRETAANQLSRVSRIFKLRLTTCKVFRMLVSNLSEEVLRSSHRRRAGRRSYVKTPTKGGSRTYHGACGPNVLTRRKGSRPMISHE